MEFQSGTPGMQNLQESMVVTVIRRYADNHEALHFEANVLRQPSEEGVDAAGKKLQLPHCGEVAAFRHQGSSFQVEHAFGPMSRRHNSPGNSATAASADYNSFL
jgi:hypothetical protein